MTLMQSLRVRVGLEEDDTSKDTEITLVKDASFAMMGNYCDRYFPLLETVEENFTHLNGLLIQLKRYPIESVTSVIDENGKEFTFYHIDHNAGLLRFDSYFSFHQVIVTFSGGYDEDALPPDLLMAFYSVFDQEWASYTSGSTVSTSDISSVTLADVGTIRYNTGNSSQSMDGAFLPEKAKSLLEDYKRFKC